MTTRIEIRVPDGTRRTRLEDFLFAHFHRLSRMYLREIVRDGLCEVNGRHENVGFRVRGGDFVEIELDPTRENSMVPEDLPLDIVYEDAHLIVINKPAGMLVHPTNRDKKGTLLNALSFHLNRLNAEYGTLSAEFVVADGANKIGVEEASNGSEENSELRVPHSAFYPAPKPEIIRPGLVHRLDKQTSGLIVIAKSVRVHRSLARQFQRKYVEKRYLALVDGIVPENEGVIDVAIGRYADEKRWDVKEGGKKAVTRYWVRERYADSTLLELEPVTGRTNQLRIHCASIGHPIVGEVSRGAREFHRLCLHAWKLTFRHPVTRDDLEFLAPIRFDASSG